jgi:hypothetical protein
MEIVAPEVAVSARAFLTHLLGRSGPAKIPLTVSSTGIYSFGMTSTQFTRNADWYEASPSFASSALRGIKAASG